MDELLEFLKNIFKIRKKSKEVFLEEKTKSSKIIWGISQSIPCAICEHVSWKNPAGMHGETPR